MKYGLALRINFIFNIFNFFFNFVHSTFLLHLADEFMTGLLVKLHWNGFVVGWFFFLVLQVLRSQSALQTILLQISLFFYIMSIGKQ